MRKRLIPAGCAGAPVLEEPGLDLLRLARVEVTSEAPEHPIEDALLPGGGGWRAAAPGPQIVRLWFDEPQRIQHIGLRFIDAQHDRRQEFVLRWSADGQSFKDIVRQQWNFSPSGATSEVEDYAVVLTGVKALELRITPDISGGNVTASLAELRLAA